MSTTIYEDDGIYVTVYCGRTGPKDRRRVQIDAKADLSYAEFMTVMETIRRGLPDADDYGWLPTTPLSSSAS